MSAVVDHPPTVEDAPARKGWAPPRIQPRHIVGLFVLLGAMAWIGPAATYWIFTINEGMMLACATLGLMVVVGWAREVSIMQAGLVGASCYLTGYAYRSADGWGLPFLLAALFGIGVVVAISVLVSLATARLSGIYIMILTLAVQVTIEKVLFTTRLAAPGFQTPRPHFLGLNLHNDRPYYIFSLVCLCALMLFLARLRASRFGRALMLAGTTHLLRCPRRVSESTVTAASRTSAVHISCAAAVRPISCRPLAITPTTRPPSTASSILPRPPNRLVPPMTAAATAYSTFWPPLTPLEIEPR